ncbi:hypothetical protein GCM10018951_03280 [Pseudarthrobacter polychromogenes]
MAARDCASSEAPSMALAFRLMVWNEPSMISPNIRGRNGTMPGLGGATYPGWPYGWPWEGYPGLGY